MSPIAAWFLYSMVIANLLGLAAVAGESALRGSGRAARWVWVVALTASVILPVMAWSGVSLRSVPSMPESVMIPLAPIALVQLETVAGNTPDLSDALGWAWLAGSLATVAFALLSWLSVRRERRGWQRRRIDGVRVMVTRDRGPAVYGVRHAEILLPEWALRLESRVRRLMLLHEGEHARAGDTRLVVLGLGVVAAAPWNLPLWWQFRRLREAIELDCDARVLRRAPDARRYGALLLEVGWRRSAPVLGVALAEPVSLLERRIRLITARAKSVSGRRVVSLGGLALLLVAVAVCTRDPMAPVGVLAGEAGEPPIAMQRVGGPMLTPFTVPPRAANRDEFAKGPEAMPSRFGAALAGGNTAGATRMPAAGPDAAERSEPSYEASPRPDRGNVEAKARSGALIESPAKPAPAEQQGSKVAMVTPPEPGLELRIPVPELAADNVVSMPTPAPAEKTGPTFTPFTTPPRLLNAPDAGHAMEREYPVLLRTSGVGGTVKVWFNIDAQGRVRETLVGETSGFASLDEAALRVARVMVFAPARNGAERIATWVSLPIKFSTR